MTSAKSPGARPWSALSTTAISLAAATAVAFTPAAAQTGGAVDRLLAAVAAYAPPETTLPARSEIDRRCAEDVVCAAALVARAFDGRATLERVTHPDTDTIRLVKTRPSVRALGRLADGAVLVALDRFGRKAEPELRAALAGLGGARLVLDLRANQGGDFERMLRVAGLFTGPVDDALTLLGSDGRRPRAIPALARIGGVGALAVLVGAGVALLGAALVLRFMPEAETHEMESVSVTAAADGTVGVATD
ncbi:MAG: hypothetical protein IIA73_10725 [Proteobacteria bacterium]|nr:hypothetical protein [Pseudomonadota bacterium]